MHEILHVREVHLLRDTLEFLEASPAPDLKVEPLRRLRQTHLAGDPLPEAREVIHRQKTKLTHRPE